MKVRYIILLVICLVCTAVCLYLNFLYQAALQDETDELEALRDAIKQYETLPVTTAPDDPTDATDPPESGKPPVTFETTPDNSESDEQIVPETTAPTPAVPTQGGSLDFIKLRSLNSDIYAWLEIPGTTIDYPVLQSPVNDKKYLKTAYDGKPYIGGAIFTEATYNGFEFDDPVTVIYGHTMRSGTLFGRLQKNYSTAKNFKKYQDIIIYLPGEVRHYTAFAAVPYDSIHLLHTYDFSVRYWYEDFFSDVKRIRAIGANFDKTKWPEFGDRVIILSVCLNEDTTKRYLVMAVKNDDLTGSTGIS